MADMNVNPLSIVPIAPIGAEQGPLDAGRDFRAIGGLGMAQPNWTLKNRSDHFFCSFWLR